MQALPISGGEQCIGFAINGSEFEKPENNPAITCDSTCDKNTTCHITKLKLDLNYFTGPLPALIHWELEKTDFFVWQTFNLLQFMKADLHG
ncbi:unnamed protein product [Prunus armeniaca]